MCPNAIPGKYQLKNNTIDSLDTHSFHCVFSILIDYFLSKYFRGKSLHEIPVENEAFSLMDL